MALNPAISYLATYFFIAEMQCKGVDILMEQHGSRRRTTDFRRGKRLGQRDHLLIYPKPERQPRWMSVELDIRNIKTTMGMDMLSCKSPDMVLKEIWVYLLAYNLIRLMMLQSALMVDIAPREISFKHCLQLWLVAANQLNIMNEDQLCTLLLLRSQQRLENRPGRIEPRVIKRRPKAFSLLRETRAKAREKINQYGHPKKLK